MKEEMEKAGQELGKYVKITTYINFQKLLFIHSHWQKKKNIINAIVGFVLVLLTFLRSH